MYMLHASPVLIFPEEGREGMGELGVEADWSTIRGGLSTVPPPTEEDSGQIPSAPGQSPSAPGRVAVGGDRSQVIVQQ